MDYDPWEELNIFIESFQPLKELDGFQVVFDSCSVHFDGNRVRVVDPETWIIEAHSGDKTTTQDGAYRWVESEYGMLPNPVPQYMHPYEGDYDD